MSRGVLLAVLLLVGCAPLPDGGMDAGAPATADGGLQPAPSGEGFCCPIGTLDCDRTPIGGWVAEDDPSHCPQVSDMAPPATVEKDAHGCDVLSGTASCHGP